MLVVLQQVKQVLDFLVAMEDGSSLMHDIGTLVLTQVAHNAQEPGEVQKLILSNHTIAVQIEDAAKAFAMLVVNALDVSRAQLHNDGKKLSRFQVSAAILIKFDELLLAVQDELLAVQVLEHFFRHVWHNLVDNSSVILQLLQQRFDSALALRQFRCVLGKLPFSSFEIRHDEDEARKVDELCLCQYAVPLNVKQLHKAKAMLVSERKVAGLAQLQEHWYSLRRFQHTTAVLVKTVKVFDAHLGKIWAENLRLQVKR
mmetsp:Transcript_11295/g.25949  ORF Transcript_11295/g.25949 Transcript_11295/m.25949 type:complete len:257 (+) Transcript_11295:905-1675(+)